MWNSLDLSTSTCSQTRSIIKVHSRKAIYYVFLYMVKEQLMIETLHAQDRSNFRRSGTYTLRSLTKKYRYVRTLTLPKQTIMIEFHMRVLMGGGLVFTIH